MNTIRKAAPWCGFLCLLLPIVLVDACGGAADVDATTATLEPVRGTPQVGGVAAAPVTRVGRGQRLEVPDGALARLALDDGPRLLLGGGARAAVRTADGAVQLDAGRLYADVRAGDSVELVMPHATLRTNDGALSVECEGAGCQSVRAYVVRGEVSWLTTTGRGRAHAGERLAVAATGAATTQPETLWTDWTGGLARPGPAGAEAPRGIGTLEGRVPGEEGLARWPLVVRRLDVRVSVQDDLAITEVDETFFNPASDTVEGLYRFRTPEGAVLQRFSVDRDGRLVDGYVREKEQAAQAYQAQVYVGSTDDPALLEWDAPGNYRARIYPIQPGATRRIVVRYAEWLGRPAAGAPRLYRYPMAAGDDARQLPIDELSIEADLSGAGRGLHVRAGLGAVVEEGRVTLRRSSIVPRADFWMEIEGGDESVLHAYRAPHESPHRAPGSRAVVNEADERDYWYLPVVLPASLAGETHADGLDVVIVADVSAATDASHLELGRSVAESIVAHLGPHDHVAIATADLRLHGLGGETTPQLGTVAAERVSTLLDDLARSPAGGATDLGESIAEAAALLDPARPGIVVYVGDGAPTVGELGADGLLTRMARLPQPVRLYAVAVGDNANLDLLETLSRGGGLAMRVTNRADGADAAMRVLAHASRPIAQRVTVDLGTGIDNAFPRRPVDVVLGDVLPVVGRIRDDAPQSVTVHGVVRGQPFTKTLTVETRRSRDATDLRLRWAGERLRQLLLDGQGREAIAELGTRYGLITPYTSYYVPSARELALMGASAANFEYQPLPRARAPHHESLGSALATIALGPLSIAGCSGSDEPSGKVVGTVSGPVSQMGHDEDGDRGERTGEEGQMGEARHEDGRARNRYGLMGPTANTTPTTTDTPAGATPIPRPTPVMPAMPGMPVLAPPAVVAAAEPEVAEQAARPNDPANSQELTDQLRALGYVAGQRQNGQGQQQPAPDPYRGAGARGDIAAGTEMPPTGMAGLGFGQGNMGGNDNDATLAAQPSHRPSGGGGSTMGHDGSDNGGGGGGGTGESHHARRGSGGEYYDFDGNNERSRDLEVDDRAQLAIQNANQNGILGALAAGVDTGTFAVTTTTRVTVTVPGTVHFVKRCSDASYLMLDDRRALWQERLGRAGGPSGIADVYRNALRDCEIQSWADRRALLELALGSAGSIDQMIQLYRLLDDGSARGYLRGAILRRVRTPNDLRLVRDAFGLDQGVDWTLVEQVLARATTPEARVRTLRLLLLQYPGSFDLKLRLLSELEAQHRMPEAKRLAEDMRKDPLADAGVRTAIGEMYVRLGDEGEAKRVFSEIVEMAPLDELARRRLGDLYRAHGWFEDAYRQYQTLAQIRPDDPTVSLLLAQAAAGAGRVDEALRLEQGIVETAEPGSMDGLARTALLWSSVRFALLRKDARDTGDRQKLEALLSRMRRSGVLRAAGALRVSLTWSHPDAQLSLWAAYPNLPLARPTDIAPELGIEALDVEDDEGGTYKVEVRRTTTDTRTAVDAQLVVVWHEGQADEQISVTPLHFGQGQTAYAWTITGRTLATATAATTATPAATGGAR